MAEDQKYIGLLTEYTDEKRKNDRDKKKYLEKVQITNKMAKEVISD